MLNREKKKWIQKWADQAQDYLLEAEITQDKKWAEQLRRMAGHLDEAVRNFAHLNALTAASAAPANDNR